MDLLAAHAAPTAPPAPLSPPPPPPQQRSNSPTAASEGEAPFATISTPSCVVFFLFFLLRLLGWLLGWLVWLTVPFGPGCHGDTAAAQTRQVNPPQTGSKHTVRVKTSKWRSGGGGGRAGGRWCQRWHVSSTLERCLPAPAEKPPSSRDNNKEKEKTGKVFVQHKVFSRHTHTSTVRATGRRQTAACWKCYYFRRSHNRLQLMD